MEIDGIKDTEKLMESTSPRKTKPMLEKMDRGGIEKESEEEGSSLDALVDTES